MYSTKSTVYDNYFMLRKGELLVMKFSRDTILKIAHLARLEINNDMIETYEHELSRILELVEQMNNVDTTDVMPMAHPQDSTLRLRSDAANEPDQRDHFQAIAPATEAGLYLVPKVIE